MLYTVQVGSGLMGVRYINADSEEEAIEKAKELIDVKQ